VRGENKKKRTQPDSQSGGVAKTEGGNLDENTRVSSCRLCTVFTVSSINNNFTLRHFDECSEEKSYVHRGFDASHFSKCDAPQSAHSLFKVAIQGKTVPCSRHSDDHGEEESSPKGALLDFLQSFRTCLNRFAFSERRDT